MHIPAAEQVDAFYRAGLEGLRYLDAREGRSRRFGEAAQAAWLALGGEFDSRDRLDLLFRDAAAVHPFAFAPRSVFQMTWLADDEPFGAEWPGVRAALAETLLRDGRTKGSDNLTDLFLTSAERWTLPAPQVAAALSDAAARITPSSRILLSGSSAMLALIQVTSSRRDLDLAEQVVVLASSTAERHLWGLALVSATARTRPRILSAETATVQRVRALGMSHLDFTMISEESSGTAGTAKAILSELGG